MVAKSIGVAAAVLSLLSASCVLGPDPRFARFVADGAYCVPRESVDRRQASRVAEEPTLPARAAVD